MNLRTRIARLEQALQPERDDPEYQRGHLAMFAWTARFERSDPAHLALTDRIYEWGRGVAPCYLTERCHTSAFHYLLQLSYFVQPEEPLFGKKAPDPNRPEAVAARGFLKEFHRAAEAYQRRTGDLFPWEGFGVRELVGPSGTAGAHRSG